MRPQKRPPQSAQQRFQTEFSGSLTPNLEGCRRSQEHEQRFQNQKGAGNSGARKREITGRP